MKNISLDELFELAKSEPDTGILDILEKEGWRNIHSKTNYAIEVFDRIIQEFPNNDQYISGAHFWKIQCYTLLKEYKKAIKNVIK